MLNSIAIKKSTYVYFDSFLALLDNIKVKQISEDIYDILTYYFGRDATNRVFNTNKNN